MPQLLFLKADKTEAHLQVLTHNFKICSGHIVGGGGKKKKKYLQSIIREQFHAPSLGIQSWLSFLSSAPFLPLSPDSTLKSSAKTTPSMAPQEHRCLQINPSSNSCL